MARIVVLIPDDVEEQLRREAGKDGYHRGAISRIVIRALLDYFEAKGKKK